MLVHAKKIVALGVMALATVVISLPVVTLAAMAPAVSVLSPLTQGLRAPVKIALDAAGNIYVADQRVGGIVKFNAYGVQLLTIRTAAAPAGLAFAQDGTLLVSQSNFVARYDVALGQEMGRLADGQLQSPVGIAIDDVTGYVYVADSSANQVVVFTASGSYVKSFGAGLLSSPTGITFEKISRQFAVASSTYGNKVQFFDVNGALQKSIGNFLSTSAGTAVSASQFAAPVAVAFEYSKDPVPVLSRIYIVDSLQCNIQVFDATASASFLSFIGSAGSINGALLAPNDATFDAVNSRLLVVNGFGNVTIYGIDGGKNPVDTTPPAFTVNPLPPEVTANTLTISGTVEAGASVQLVSGGTPVVGAVAYPTPATWSADVSGFVAGNNVFTVTATDAAGNIAPALAVTVNYLAPAPAVTISPVPAITNLSKLVIGGTVDAGATVVVSQAAAAGGNAVVNGTAWSYEATLAYGTNSLTVTAQKPNSAQTVATATVILDNSAPVLVVSALAGGSYTSTQVQNISGTVKDLSSVSVSVNGTPAVLAGSAFSVPVTLLTGPNVISVVAVDAVGNTTTDNRTIYFDITKPVVTVTAPVDNSFTSTAVLTLSGSVDKTSVVTVAGVPVISDAANNWSATVELVAGVNTIEIAATDLSGNSSSVKRSITLDTSRPTLAVVTPAQDIAVNIPNVQIAGTVADDTRLTLEYSINGSPAVLVPVSGGAYSFNVDFAAEGNYPVTITAKDAAGNTTTAVRNVIYDITPPLFTLNASNGFMPEKLSGTVEAGSTVVVKESTTQIGTVTIANGSWTADLSGVNYTPGNLLAVATDAAGNSTSKTLSYSFPDGSLAGDGKPTVQDALHAIRLVVSRATPTAQELAHYDIGPLVNGMPNPNGKIEIVDAILILRKALGLKSW